jgi:hypothetical protein
MAPIGTEVFLVVSGGEDEPSEEEEPVAVAPAPPDVLRAVVPVPLFVPAADVGTAT